MTRTDRRTVIFRMRELRLGERFSTVINGTQPIYVTRLEVRADTVVLCGFRSRFSFLNPRRVLQRSKPMRDSCLAQQAGVSRYHRALINDARQQLTEHPGAIPAQRTPPISHPVALA